MNRSARQLGGWLAGLPMALLLAGESGEPSKVAAADETAILDTAGTWRCKLTLQTPTTNANPTTALSCEYGTSWPEDGWTGPDFDDGGWTAGSWLEAMPAACRDQRVLNKALGSHLAALCVRGRFSVADPAKAGPLRLSLAYRGGVVVYVNGLEVARGHLPAGALEAGTVAEAYPEMAWMSPHGAPRGASREDAAKHAQEVARARDRRLADIDIPRAALRQGVNVLAIEAHRAPAHPTILKSSYTLTKPWEGWPACGVDQAKLAGTGETGGIVGNTARPRGLRVWNHSIVRLVRDTDYGDAHEPLRPMRIVGARGGSFSGQVVAGCDEPLKGLRATAGDLKRKGGGGTIAADRIQVRYGLLQTVSLLGDERGSNARRFFALAETPPAEVSIRKYEPKVGEATPSWGAVQPVWVTVSVPADAAAGVYEGSVAIRADGHPEVAAPVELRVSGWRLPEMKEDRVFLEFYESPETLALRYKAPLWSEKHWELVERTFRHLGEIGSDIVYVPLICKTGIGNEQSMVRWVKKGGGTYDYDFTPMDRYLDIAVKHLGKPWVLCFMVYDLSFSYGHKLQDGRVVNPLGGIQARPPVTVWDPATGRTEELEGPEYTDEAGLVEFWGPLVEGLRKRLKDRGLEDAAQLGHVNDMICPKATADAWGRLWPGRPWASHSHFSGVQGISVDRRIHGQRGGFCSAVYYPKPMPRSVLQEPNPGRKVPAERLFGWMTARREFTFVNYPRNAVCLGELATGMLWPEGAISAGGHGRSAMAADFFPYEFTDEQGKTRMAKTMACRYPQTSWLYMGWLGVGTYLDPGPEGPRSSVSFDTMRHGIQECQAKIMLEEALLDEEKRAKLGDDLTARCWRILDERREVCMAAYAYTEPAFLAWLIADGWHDRATALYAAAGEVAGTLEDVYRD